MIKWYDNAGVYVGYAAPVNGVIHYFTRNISGVITDVGTTKPAGFVTTHCAPADTTVKVRSAGVLAAGSFTNFNFGLNQPSLFTSSFTNTFTVPILFTLHFVSARGIAAPAGQQYVDSVVGLTSSVSAISYAFSPTFQGHRDDFEHNQTVGRTYQKYDQASTHVFLLAVGQTVSFTGFYAFSLSTIPVSAFNYLEYKLNYQIVEA